MITKSRLIHLLIWKILKNGGEQGIRTPERVAPLHAFQACAFNHSANSPHNQREHTQEQRIFQTNLFFFKI